MAAETTAVGAPSGAPAPTPSPIVSFVPVIVICAILYFLIIRPQQRQAKDLKRLVDNLKPGDRVLTQGGIYGNVVSLKGSIVVLKIADNVKVDVSRTGIAQVVTEPSSTVPAPPQEVVN